MKIIVLMLLYCSAAMAYEDLQHQPMVAILNDKKLFGEVFGCIVDVNPCENEFGAHLKSHVVEIMSDACRECDNPHKHYVHATISTLRNDFPELYKKFEEKYDPSGVLMKKLDEAMIKYA